MKILILSLVIIATSCNKLEWAYESCDYSGEKCRITAKFEEYEACNKYIYYQNWMSCKDDDIKNSRPGEAICYKVTSSHPDGKCIKQ